MRKSTVLLSGLLLLTNLGWLLTYLYSALDHGVSLTYQQAGYETTAKMLDQALIIANENLVGQSLHSAQAAMTQDVYGLQPFIKEGCLHAGGLCLRIDSNNLISGVAAE